ncbi:Helix-turn-helix domain-containing protein [Hyphomicrobiales bacterium]|nr:Helix-turn-helix domain-containing protein [Hyphomicrobiales bacterium]CAH1663885.1 Helix-turn-helix domain-containing protein [Hyphomicrobiales bacterium]
MPTLPVMLDIVKRAAENVGGLTRLATHLGIRHQTFYSWRRIPAERVRDIERVAGLPAHELRPDLFPPPVRGEAA